MTLRLSLETPAGAPFEIALARAGQSLAGPPPGSPVMGWYSPTYGVKQPALSLSLLGRAPAPVRLVSEFIFE